MKKNLIIFLVLFFSYYLVNAQESEEVSYMNNITYTDNLDSNTVFNLNWNNFSKCSDLFVNSTKIEPLTKNENTITFKIEKLDKYLWEISLKCDNKIQKLVYSFPYISWVWWIVNWKINWDLSINWINFWDNADVFIEWWKFEKTFQNDKNIVWNFDKIENSEFYITSNWYKSNLFKLDLVIPKIDFILWEDNFNSLSYIKIYSKNFSKENLKDTELYVGDLKIEKYEFIDNYLKVKLPDTIWSNDVYFNFKWIKSNVLSLNISNWRPLIEKIEEKFEVNEWNWENIKYYYIYWKNFWNNINTKLYLNWKDIIIDNIVSKSLIKIKKIDLFPWENFFEIIVNNKSSNIFNYYVSTAKLPELWGYSISKINQDLMTVLLYVQNFSSSTDFISYNWTKINNPVCTNNSCLISLSSNEYKWYFEIWRWAYISPIKIKFDLSESKKPYISKIIFNKDLVPYTSFEIIGWNFDKSSISHSNFLNTNTSWEYDIYITNNKITWYLSKEFDEKQDMSLTISNNEFSTNLTFKKSDLWKDNSILWPVVINWLKSSNWFNFFKAWTNIEIVSNNVNTDSIVKVWDNKIKIVYQDNWKNSYFTIPSNIVSWEYDFSVLNSNWIESQKIKIIISDDEDWKIFFDNNSIESKKLYVDSKQNFDNPIYSIKIYNKIEDIILKNIEFNLIDKKSSELWTFYLKLDNVDVWKKAVFTSNWNMNFWNILLEKSSQPKILSLYKDSSFINEWSFEIILNSNSISLNDLKSNKFEYFKTSNYLKNKIIVWFLENQSCIDSDKTNLNCNSFFNKTLTNSSNLNQTTTIDKLENNNNVDKNNTQWFKINIKTFNFKSKSYSKLNDQFKLYALKLEKNTKYVNNYLEIENSINWILESLEWYEKSSNNKIKKKIYAQKLKLKIKQFKESIK